MSAKRYTELGPLKDVVLEESYVLDILARPSVMTIVLDAVLTPGHVRYHAPRPNEYLCYARGSLIFRRVHHLVWEHSGRPPAVDATGETDYGSVDVCEIYGDRYVLSGEFGTIELTCDEVAFEFDE